MQDLITVYGIRRIPRKEKCYMKWKSTPEEADLMKNGTSFVRFNEEDDTVTYNLGKTKEEGAEVCRKILKAQSTKD